MNLVLDFDGRRLQGVRPFAVFEAKDGCWKHHNGAATREGSNGVLNALRDALAWSRDNVSNRGAAIGYFAYDFARMLDPRAFSQTSPPDDFNIPDVRLVFFEELQTSNLAPDASQFPAPSRTDYCQPTTEYSNAVARIKNYIAAGDIYQANYAERFSFPISDKPAELYARLQSTHAAPFAALLQWDDFSIVSNSPERFLKLQNGVLTSQPIKGTARRGSTPEEDEAFKIALQNSAKDRAENVMIVDLLRNDLGRVCQYGSIKVPQLFETQTFPTLHHLVSTVSGVLRADCDALDAFAAAFPCGSITGAPKIRAMQIIDEIEGTRRGASFGAIGYFGFDGDMEWNVAIRTVTCVGDMAHFHAGGGIVADSSAQDEYSEMQLKAAALQRALREFSSRTDAANPL